MMWRRTGDEFRVGLPASGPVARERRNSLRSMRQCQDHSQLPSISRNNRTFRLHGRDSLLTRTYHCRRFACLDPTSRLFFGRACEKIHKRARKGADSCRSPRFRRPPGIEPAFDLAAYYPILIYAVVVVAVRASARSRPRTCSRSSRASRRASSRCRTSRAWTRSARPGMQFDVKFYLIAILFLVFDVELLFLYPWAVIAYGDGGDQIVASRRSARSCSAKSSCSSPRS